LARPDSTAPSKTGQNSLSAADTTKLFGTDGIRAEAGKFPLDRPTISIIGRSLTRHLEERTERSPRIVIGRDTRESGEWIACDLTDSASKAGADIHSAGVITTPGVAFLTRALTADAGIVISASHNPYHDNGIKIFERSGRKLDDAVERRIERDITENKRTESPGPDAPVLSGGELDTEADALHQKYLEFLADEVGRDLSLDSQTIVVDCANGAAYKLAPELLTRLGARVHAINVKPNGRNINLDSGSLHPERLQHAVREGRPNLGVAFDGDADRALFVDANGNIVDGDATLWILANYLESRGELNDRQVIATTMSNIGLEVALREKGISLVRTDVGDKYVLDELVRRDASLGGEQSGHIIFPRISLAGDGMITMLCLLHALQDQSKPLHQLAAGFHRYPQVLVNVRVREKVPFERLPAVKRSADEIQERFRGCGRVLLRYSGTEPLARIMIEGESQNEIEAAANALAKVISREIGEKTSR
jgi:phosphoglucosamine mutase